MDLRRSTLERLGILWIVAVKPCNPIEMVGKIGEEPGSPGEVSVSDTGRLHEGGLDASQTYEMHCTLKSSRFFARYAGIDSNGYPMDDQDFRRRADHALEDLHRRLSAAGDKHDFGSDFVAGALVVEFEEPPAKFVVSPNAPVGQIWVSAHMKSFKLDWVAARNAFVLPESGQTLAELLAAAITEKLGEEVSL